MHCTILNKHSKTLWYFSFSLGPCGQILLFNLPPFTTCLSTVIILLGFLQHFPNWPFICHKEVFWTEHNMTGWLFSSDIHADYYYLPILQGSMSGYPARTLQCFFLHCKIIVHSKPTTYFTFSCILQYFLATLVAVFFPTEYFLNYYFII